MKSARHGKSTSGVEVANISAQGFWLLVNQHEYFVPFSLFPWFRDASIGQLLNVELPRAHHLYWPELDVDLHVDSLSHPEAYPLVSSLDTEAPPRKKRREVRRKSSRNG
jgi:hypothetical protein